MSISPVPIRHMAPLSNITPFTYSDGWTYLQVLTRLREYLQDVLTPEFAKAIEDTYNEFQSAMDEYHAGMTVNVEQFNQLFTDYVANVEARFLELAEPMAKEAVDNYLADPATLSAHVISTTARDDSVKYGPELAVSEGWTLGSGWTGDYANGFTHSPTGVKPLTGTIPGLSIGDTYMLEFTITGADANAAFEPEAITVTLGGVDMYPIYEGGSTVTTYRRGFTATTLEPLVFTPISSGLVATVSGISVRQVVGGALPTFVWRDSSGNVDTESRTNGNSNIFFGLNSGRYSAGRSSVGVGDNALSSDISGFFNVAVGARALQNAERVSRNVAVGFRSLENNLGGDRNVAVGPFAQHSNILGRENTSVGIDTLFNTKRANGNVAIGLYSMAWSEDVTDNTAVGKQSLQRASNAVANVAVGPYALNNVQGNRNVAVGEMAGSSFEQVTASVSVGARAHQHTTSGGLQVAVGWQAGQHSNGVNNVAVGANSLSGKAGLTNGIENVAVGYNAGINIESGSNNTLLGTRAGGSLRNGSNNIAIGNSVSVGVNADNLMNIGNLIHGRLDTKRIGINVETPHATLHLPAGDGTVASAPLKISSGGTLTPSPEPGALEYANGKLYFSTGAGRHEITMTLI